MSTEVRVPTLGESVTEATVATWFKKTGDQVAVDEMLCELETDKVTVEVPSPIAGTISEIIAPEGTTVSVEALLAQISEGATAPALGSETHLGYDDVAASQALVPNAFDGSHHLVGRTLAPRRQSRRRCGSRLRAKKGWHP